MTAQFYLLSGEGLKDTANRLIHANEMRFYAKKRKERMKLSRCPLPGGVQNWKAEKQRAGLQPAAFFAKRGRRHLFSFAKNDAHPFRIGETG
jgi:hypothetical protein